MKKIFTLIVVALLGISQAWAGKVKIQLYSSPSAGGYVYANTEDKNNMGTKTSDDATSSYKVGGSVTMYRYAQARDGYNFSGWAESDGGTPSSTSSSISLGASVGIDTKTYNYYAIFTPISYSFVFHGNGSTSGSMENQAFKYGTAQNLRDNAFERSFAVTYDANGGDCAETDATATYSFGGWATSETGTVVYANQQNISNLTTVDGTVYNVYAKWTDGEVILPTPTNGEMLFDGWYNGETWVGNAGDSYAPTADVELTAHWAEKLTPMFVLSQNLLEPSEMATLTLTNVDNPTIEITPDGIIEYDEMTGTITALAAGKATISITQEATGTLSYKHEDLEVAVKLQPSLSVKLNDVAQTNITIYQGKTAKVCFDKVSDAEVAVSVLSGGASASYSNGTITAGEVGTAIFRATLPETDTYKSTYVDFSVKVIVDSRHLPMTFTFDHWNDGNIKVASEGDNSWDNDKQITLGSTGGGGFSWDDKYIIIHFEGVPDKLSFQIATKGLAGGPTGVQWYVQEGATKDVTSGKIWTSTYGEGTMDFGDTHTIQLAPTSRYVKICYAGNFGGYVRNLQISELKYVQDPEPASLDFGTAVISTGEVKKTVNVNWCNIAPLSVVSSNDRFTVSPSVFGNYDEMGSQEITISYTHTSEVGDNEGDITISNGNDAYTKTIHVHAQTTKRIQTVTWDAELVATGYALNVDEVVSAIATTQNGEEIVFSSSDESVIKVENGALVAIATGTAEITAYQAGDNEYAEVTDTKPFTVTSLRKQSITWDQNLYGLLTTSDPVDLTATATSNMDIEYTSGDESVVRIDNGNQLVVVGEGETYITASQAGGVDGEGEEWLPISLNNYVIVRNPASQCNEMALSVNSLTLKSGQLSKEYALSGTPTSLTFSAKHGTKPNGAWAQKPTYAALLVDQYAKIENVWGWYTVYNTVVGTDPTASGTIALDESATKVRFRTTENETEHTITNIQIPRKKFLRSSVDAIDENAEKNTIWQKTITISHSNIDLMTVSTEEGLLTLSTGTLGSGCGDFGDHSFIVSFTPTEKYVDYYDKIIITDGKATPSTIEIPVHLYSTGFNQTLNGFSLPSTCLTTDEVEMPVVTTNTGLTPVEFLSSDSAIAYVENNVLKILKAGSVDIIAYQAGDDRYNEVSETKTIDIQLAPSTILQAPEALMIVVGSELSVSTLRNGQADVEGTFAWADGSEVLTTAGDFEREVIFVPSADTIYATASVMVTVSVTDGAAITEYPTLSDIVYGQELGEAAIIGGAATVSGTFNLTSDPMDVYDAGDVDIYMVFTPDDPSYDEVPFIITLHIEQAEPEIYTYPTATDVEEGQTLAESLLDGGEASELGYFDWADNTVEPTVGTHDYEVLFVPDDVNYKAVSIWVSVHVNGTTTSLDEVEINAAATKVLRNGVLYIQRNGNTYSVQGKKIE